MTTDQVARRPKVAVAASISAEQARITVARRLREPTDLDATLYHHPFLGVVFTCRTSHVPLPGKGCPAPMLAYLVVDLVGGLAYLSDPWDESCFVPLEPTDATTRIRGPEPQVEQAVALSSARAVLAGAVLRRRRLDIVAHAELLESPVLFGKPNWWVTGRRGDNRVQVIVDATTGRHYACSI